MTTPLEGKLALVTGAASGIGRATAQMLALRGADVALVDLASCAELSDEITAMGRRCVALEADVGDEAQARTACQQAFDTLGGLDIMVNSAGIIFEKPLLEMSVVDRGGGLEAEFQVALDLLVLLGLRNAPHALEVAVAAQFSGLWVGHSCYPHCFLSLFLIAVQSRPMVPWPGPEVKKFKTKK